MVEKVACSDLADLRVTCSGHCGEPILCVALGRDAARVVPWRTSVRFDTTSGVDLLGVDLLEETVQLKRVREPADGIKTDL
jgi:hypothetical protein